MDSKEIKRLTERRHPAYKDSKPHWDFLEMSYQGGRQWFEGNVFRYMKEGDLEYQDRVKRAYRFNHSKEVVDLVDKYLFRAPIVREDNAPDYLKTFWGSATKRGVEMDDFARVISRRASTLGCPWLVVDNNFTFSADENASKADESEDSGKVYCYLVNPQDVLDFSYDDEGELRWILLREYKRDDANPAEDNGDVKEQFRLWERNSWTLFGKSGRAFVQLDVGIHNLNRVPAIRCTNSFEDDPYTASALIADVAYLDRAVANYLSNLDAIIQDQTFSQLALPAQGVLPGSDGAATLREMGTKRLFLYDGESGSAPMFLAPDPRQAALIISAIQQLINEIYHSVGLAGERTKQDNAKGIDNSSGVAKERDFDRVLALLKSKASMLESIENQVAELVAAWNGDTKPLGKVVTYSETFNIRDLDSELAIAASVMTLDAPAGVQAEEMKLLVEKLFPNLAGDIIEELKSEVEDWAKDREEQSLMPMVNGLAPQDGLPSAPRDLASEGAKQSQTKASSN